MKPTSNIIASHKKLCQEIERHNKPYYLYAKPVITDKEFDALYRHLLDMEKEHPELISPDSPSQRVGYKP